jgi:hypothetical protein
MLVSVVVLGVAILAAPGSAYAQGGSQYLVTKVDFPFNVNGQTFEPGSYRVERRADMPTLMIQAVGGKASGTVPIVTRLAKRDGGSKDSGLVFDKVGETYVLSEVWIPGQDGFLVNETREEHVHAVVK